MEIVFHIEGWEWEKREFGWRSFWTVKTPSMNSWIVKYTGSVYSYREWVFSRLASHLGLNTRNVSLARISESDLHQTGQQDSDPFQLLLEPVETHSDTPCNPNCPFPEWQRCLREENDICEKLGFISIDNAVDYILKDFMADIFGANEPSEYLFGADHRFYIIDNEQMFSTKGSGEISAPWLFAKNNAYSECGHNLLIDLCRKIISLTDANLRDIARCPDNYKVNKKWPILPILRKGKKIAYSILTYG